MTSSQFNSRVFETRESSNETVWISVAVRSTVLRIFYLVREEQWKCLVYNDADFIPWRFGNCFWSNYFSMGRMDVSENIFLQGKSDKAYISINELISFKNHLVVQKIKQSFF